MASHVMRIEAAGRLSKFRHYVNLAKTESRLDRLLQDFSWDRMDRVYADVLARPASASGAHAEPAISATA